jgi:hypothetical protein
VAAAPASFELDIVLAGLLETTYDWELAAGTCSEPGGRIGTDGNYAVLEPAAAGSIAATTVVPAVLAESAPYHVSVFMMVSGEEDDLVRVTVACGDLQRVG